jgi:NAD-dependent deacetylase
VSCQASRAIAPEQVDDEAAPLPRCACGEMLRPAVVWFGEALDPAVVAQAWSAVEEADALLVVGTSAVVFPVAALPDVARAKRVPVVEINLDDTPLTPRADFVVRATAATALSALESAL